MNGAKVLVVGASFAGLSTAYWLRQLGYAVTVVEIHGGLRTGGTAVNIREQTIDIVKRMGIYDAIRAQRLHLERWEMIAADGSTARVLDMPASDDDLEVERNVLLYLLYDLVKNDVELVFGDTVTALSDAGDGVDVRFVKASPRRFDLVFGCDGTRSRVRQLWFGGADYQHFLEQYFSITIVDELLIPRNTAQLFNVPGKAVMLNAYKNNTDVIFSFVATEEIAYDHRDESAQRRIVAERFAGEGWRVPELLQKVQASTSFYFDKLCQIRMPSWSRGRVALVGDAGYCASPAAGMGGSLAIDGAAALGAAMQACPGDHVRAFAKYEADFRPFLEGVQAEAVRTGLETLVPRTEEAIRARNEMPHGGF